jgi:uncharacterized membrane protein YheB (UPF0754 family)
MILIGLLVSSPQFGELLTNCGIFALVGALTNWLALRFLFSNLMLHQVETFKATIKVMIMREFFSLETVEKMVTSRGGELLYDFSHIDECLDYDALFEATIEAILESQIGSMIKLVRQQGRLDSLRPIFKKKMKKIILEYSHSKKFKKSIIESTDSKAIAKMLIVKIGQVIDIHLEELTTDKLKNLINENLSKSQGWLVVLAGFMGGIMGAAKTLLF